LPELQGQFACTSHRLPCSDRIRSLISDIRENRANTLNAAAELPAKTAVGTKNGRDTLLYGVYQGKARRQERLFKVSLLDAGVTRKLMLGAKAAGRFSCLFCAESSRRKRVKIGGVGPKLRAAETMARKRAVLR
jgi:hypothetical protein